MLFVIFLILNWDVIICFCCIPTPTPRSPVLTSTTPITTSTTTTSTSSTSSTTTTTTTTTTTPLSCPTGWQQQAFSGVDYCYLMVFGDGTTAVNQATAQAACVAQGANLVSIHSTQENNYVLSLAISTSSAFTLDGFLRSTWIGLTLASEIGTLQTFFWTDGTPVDFPAGNPYTSGAGPVPWAQGIEPQAAGGGCVQMITNLLSLNPPFIYGSWNNIGCNVLMFNYVCKKLL